jgi:hypothetical protein
MTKLPALVALLLAASLSELQGDALQASQASVNARPRSATAELVGFAFTIYRDAQGLSMHCQLGCVWPASLSSSNGDTLFVTDSGAVTQRNVALERGRFVVSIERTTADTRVSCEKGCAWTNLNISCEKGGTCGFTVTEHGITPIDVAGLARNRSALGDRVARLNKPDFTGRWALETRGAPGNPAVELIIKQSTTAPTGSFAIDRRFEGTRRSDLCFIGAGSVAVETTGARKQMSCDWDGTALILSTTTHKADSTASSAYREVWSLLPNDRLSVSITQSVAGTVGSTTSLIYVRR